MPLFRWSSSAMVPYSPTITFEAMSLADLEGGGISFGLNEKFGEFIWMALSIGLFTLGAVVCREIAGWFMAKVIAKGGDIRNLPFFNAQPATAGAAPAGSQGQQTTGRPSLWQGTATAASSGTSRIDPNDFR